MKKDMFEDLLKSTKEADKIINGEARPSRTFEVSAPDIKKIRYDLGTSQADFAFMIGVPVNTLKNWEQGRRQPQGSALALLNMFKNNPKGSFDILHATRR